MRREKGLDEKLRGRGRERIREREKDRSGVHKTCLTVAASVGILGGKMTPCSPVCSCSLECSYSAVLFDPDDDDDDKGRNEKKQRKDEREREREVKEQL